MKTELKRERQIIKENIQSISYGADEASEEVSADLYIREGDGEWKELFVEVEE